MKITALAILITALARSAAPASAQDDARIQRVVDTMVRLCLAGGHTEVKGGSGKGGVDVSLKSFDARGNLSGDFHFDSSSAEGLVGGINNALTEVAASEADKVRECLKPVRDRLLDAMLPQGDQGSTPDGGSGQITHGSHSPAINNVHGNVTITEGK